MKTAMSSFDIMAMVDELPRELRIKKVYQPSPTELRIQVRVRGGGNMNLLMEVGKKMYLSDYALPSPRFPSNFAMTLRKYLSNAIIKEIRQVGFDRIIEIVTETAAGEYRLVIELFGEGNALLVDHEGIIKTVMKPKRFKHRNLVGKEVYQYPPQRRDPFTIEGKDVQEAVSGFGSLVKTLAIPLGMGGAYAEEVCLRSGLDKTLKTLSDEEADLVVTTLEDLKKEALSQGGYIVLEGDEIVDITPVRMRIHEGRTLKGVESFNKALDEVFTKRIVEEVKADAKESYRSELGAMGHRLLEQAKAIKRFKKEDKRSKETGDLIYLHFQALEELIKGVSKARKTMDDKDLLAQLKHVKAVKKYDPNKNTILISLDGFDLTLDLDKTASENANDYYTRSKKAREKLAGARKAAQATKERMARFIKEEALAPAVEVLPQKRKARKMRWYERFRWFYSSDGFLVIGGRDASSNEVIVKRHMDKGDLFIHADIHGAPAIVIKSGGKDVPDSTIEEACQFAASNSTAWKAGAAYLDVYWVLPDQVSKSPQSGEYVAKGAFIIRGKRNYKRSKVALSIGYRIEDDDVIVMAAPPRAVESYCNGRADIFPGRLKSKEAALKIKEAFIAAADEEEEPLVKRLNIDFIQKVLPTGYYQVKVGR